MKNMSLSLLLGCLLLQVGCAGSHQIKGPVVYVIDTIDGQQYVVSARVGEDGKFANSISKDNRTQTMSGQVTKSGDNYLVTIDYNYNCVRADSPGVSHIKTSIQLQEGQLQDLGGIIGNDVVRIRISSE